MMLKIPFRKLPGKAPEAVMVPKAIPPPPPLPGRKGFSELRPFGLKLLLKYKATQEFWDENGNTSGLKFQVWAEGECCSLVASTAV